MKRIFIWYCVLAVTFWGGISFVVFPAVASRLEIPDVNYMSPFLLDFEKRLFRYRNDPLQYHNAIVGPSYAAELGEFGDFANLSMSGTHLKERQKFIKYCETEDVIFYYISILDSGTASMPARPDVIYSALRRLKVLRMTLNLSPNNDKPPKGDYINKVRFLQTTRNLECSDVIPHCKKILEKEPKVIFVIHPLCSAKIGRDLSCFEHDLEAAFQKSGLPHLNLRGIYTETTSETFHI